MLSNTIRKLSAALAATAALSVCTAAQAFTPPSFPRLAGIEISPPYNYNDPSYQAQLAKQSISILSYWPGMAPGGESMNSIVKSIKAINPNSLVFFYIESDYQNPYGSTDAYTSLRDKLNAMHWWLYPNTSFSSPVPSVNSNSWYTINNTPYTPKDSNGNDSIDWLTKWFVSNIYDPNPAIDGFFMDNVFVKPNVAGDWYRNGTVLQPSDPKAQAAIQAGYERYFSLVHTLLPSGTYELANAGYWNAPNQPGMPSGYVGMANGGVMEGLLGKSWSVETWAGWQTMMNMYYADMNDFAAPKLAIFNQWGDPTDYQSFRYGFASCLMNDGYYDFTSDSASYNGVVWFDEYNANLGQPVSSPPTAAWQKGVWRRDFTNGIALVNPKGNGPQTVQLGGTFYKIKGKQDPAVNNGQAVTSVTLQDRDGIILLRQAPLRQPKAPTGLSISGG
jgi:hypothetical protein